MSEAVPVFEKRSAQLEFIDTGDYTPAEYDDFLIDIRRINRLLGDSRALRNSLLRDVQKRSLREFSLLDVGAGSGELLRVCAEFANREGIHTKLFGLELNARSACAMREESIALRNIYPVRGDAFQLPFADQSFDFVISSLFLHHFNDETAPKILREMKRVARLKVYVIDLERHPISYFLYTKFVNLFLRSPLTKHDGALSILRGFRPNELHELARNAGFANAKVTRHFPYRLVLS
jgi:ubiquinone/menaquinone biosynthesis C-methylase UbiE